MKWIDLYTDGACSGNPGPGGWAAILKYNVHEKQISGGEPMTTNNRMELTAVIQGLRLLREPCQVNIVTDSKYVVDAIQRGWIHSWIKNNFKGKKNEDLWRQLIELLKIHQATFTWIHGHAGHEYNERCDKLAVMERTKFKTYA